MDNIDPREFVIPASDRKGHSERVWVRIQAGHDRQLSTVLNSKWFPYQSKGDIIRHALARHLAWLETIAPVPSVTAQVNSIIELIREEQFDTELQDIIHKMEEQISLYLAAGQVGRAKSLVSRILSKIDQMPEGEWKDVYKKMINDKYASFISGTSVKLRGEA